MCPGGLRRWGVVDMLLKRSRVVSRTRVMLTAWREGFASRGGLGTAGSEVERKRMGWARSRRRKQRKKAFYLLHITSVREEKKQEESWQRMERHPWHGHGMGLCLLHAIIICPGGIAPRVGPVSGER